MIDEWMKGRKESYVLTAILILKIVLSSYLSRPLFIWKVYDDTPKKITGSVHKNSMNNGEVDKWNKGCLVICFSMKHTNWKLCSWGTIGRGRVYLAVKDTVVSEQSTIMRMFLPQWLTYSRYSDIQNGCMGAWMMDYVWVDEWMCGWMIYGWMDMSQNILPRSQRNNWASLVS